MQGTGRRLLVFVIKTLEHELCDGAKMCMPLCNDVAIGVAMSSYVSVCRVEVATVPRSDLTHDEMESMDFMYQVNIANM